MCATAVTAEFGARQQRRRRRTEVESSSGKDKLSESATGWSAWASALHFVATYQPQFHLSSQTSLPSQHTKIISLFHSPNTMSNKPTFFVNASTSSPEKAKVFYTALGFTPAEWCDVPTTKALTLPAPNENICLMIHAVDCFKKFIPPDATIADTAKTNETLLTIAVNSRDEVDALLAKAVAAGGKSDPYTMKDHGAEMGMYVRSFTDLDGHLWEAFFMEWQKAE
ncbi:uncharacterized protein VDAG_07661 [Verticillium dahliae VdLs.17]|uniref:VOC domain-containing protein n=1 Tax=Verticillium dahliae (strain VdLs.17 / ATCC MYA-4575 / FGSC 10137) TaxID=498257 RepID=G2XBX9_VERDV|nr:uncharacterized protein VDAG_07661 [Verticillium dahliae VdLs.17]EGY16497.1 hypothetical protein VDAG_07661 [Verticillium dahliae VdLs.17]